LEEWLADPDGSAKLREAAGAAPILADAELRRVIGNFPLGPARGLPAHGDHGRGVAQARRGVRPDRSPHRPATFVAAAQPLARLSISRSRIATLGR
jgi:hypothetical protein